MAQTITTGSRITSLDLVASLAEKGVLTDDPRDTLKTPIANDIAAARAIVDPTNDVMVTLPGRITLSGAVSLRKFEPVWKVFNTPELLEAIFAHLSVKDLVRLEAVCKGTGDVIESSPVLRRMLWRVPHFRAAALLS